MNIKYFIMTGMVALALVTSGCCCCSNTDFTRNIDLPWATEAPKPTETPTTVPVVTGIPSPIGQPTIQPTLPPIFSSDVIIGTWQDKGAASSKMTFNKDGSFLWDVMIYEYKGAWEKIEDKKYKIAYYDTSSGTKEERILIYNRNTDQLYIEDTPYAMFARINK
jgi:hypothetical protein